MSVSVDRLKSEAARGTIFAGGIALVAGALAFLGVFSYLAARFHYPEVLDGAAGDVLPALLATGSAGRAAWALYGILPLIFIPAGVAAFEALRERAAGPARVGMQFAFLAAIAMMLGLMRWPSVHWELALAWNVAGPDQRLVLAALFDGLNRYLGNYLGEFLGELVLQPLLHPFGGRPLAASARAALARAVGLRDWSSRPRRHVAERHDRRRDRRGRRGRQLPVAGLDDRHGDLADAREPGTMSVLLRHRRAVSPARRSSRR